jgi:hypothetical protein
MPTQNEIRIKYARLREELAARQQEERRALDRREDEEMKQAR